MRTFISGLAFLLSVLLLVASGSKTAARAVTTEQESKSDSAVQYFSAADVKRGYATNATLLSGPGHAYTIITGFRDKPGQVEVHANDTDVIYIVEGSATFVTGGRVLEPTTSAPGETRGREIEGGDAHQLAKGDVIVIPAGVPHWFKTVQTPFNDFIVKVRTAAH
jgi:quercetin dioxygenase-like cupin family protein